MKKLISLLLVFVMCAALFVGCAKEDTTGLDKAKEYLFSMYKDSRDTETAIDYTVVSAVSIDSTTYKITWTIEKVEGDISCLSVEAGTTLTTIKVAKNFTKEVVKYNLVGTIADDNGNTVSVKFGHSVPVSKPVQSLKDGTYVISTDGKSMAAMGETYTYGYPTANAVTETNFTAADIVTIKNVTGGVTIQDCYGRYYYLKGSYNSFNLSKDMPEEGHVFELQINDDNTVSFVNILMQKTLAYSTSYTSWGCYAELGDGYLSALTIFAADENNAHVHTEVVVPGKEATCTEDGLTEGKKCSECGAILVEQKTIPAAHTWGEWTVTKEATADEEGEETRTCSVCHEEETRAIGKLTVIPAYVKDAPVIGKAYQFGLFHGNENADVFFNGKNYEGKNGVMAWYLAYTTNREGAVDVFVEAVEGVENAYRLYFMNGEEKTFIRTYPRDGYEGQGTLELTTSVPSEYYTFSTDYHTLIYTDADGNQFYLGSSGTYSSISVSPISYTENETSYISHLYNPDAGAEPDDGKDDNTTEPDDGDSENSEKIILNCNGKYITATAHTFTNANTGSSKNELTISENKTEAVELTVRKNADGTVTFVTADGKYLMSDGTNVEFVSNEGENTLFVLEETTGGYFIKCANASYNGNAQYLEVYSGYLTVYGKYATSDATIYTFAFETVA